MFGYRHGKGAIVVDGKQVGETLQCVHCGSHHEIKPGSGTKRGFCPMCKGFVCGAAFCMAGCSPFEARLELTEALGEGNIKDIKTITQRYDHIRPL